MARTAEELREYQRAYQQRPEVREKERLRSRQRERDDPNITRERNHRRRARMLGAYVEHVESLVVLERDDGVCGICGGDVDPLDFHVDHIVPISRGGAHAYFNVQPAHPLCNTRKHNNCDAPLIPYTPAGRRSARVLARDELIVVLLADGATYAEVAEQLDVCYATVRIRVKTMRDAGRIVVARSRGDRRNPERNGWPERGQRKPRHVAQEAA